MFSIGNVKLTIEQRTAHEEKTTLGSKYYNSRGKEQPMRKHQSQGISTKTQEQRTAHDEDSLRV